MNPQLRFESLDLSRKHLITLEGVKFPEKLHDLNLSRNQITTLEGVIFPEGLEHLNLSHNQITTLKGVTLPKGLVHLDLSHNNIRSLEGVRFPSTVRTLNLSHNPDLRLTGVNDLSVLGWNEYIPGGAPPGELNLTETSVTLKGDLCFVKTIPSNLHITLGQKVYKNVRGVNEIKEACVAMTSNPASFGESVIHSMHREGGKKRQHAKRQQTRRQQTRRQHAKRQQQTRRQSKLKK